MDRLRDRRRAIALPAAVATLVVLTALDAALGAYAVIGLVVFAPLLGAMFGGPGEVAALGAGATLVVLLSGTWNENFGELVHVQRSVAVAAISAITWYVARARRRLARDARRFELLAAISEVADGSLTLDDTVAAIHDLVVPGFADACIVDVVRGGQLTRLAVRVSEREDVGGRVSAAIAARPPGTADAIGDPEQARLMRVDDALLRAIATDDADLARLRGLGISYALLAPLNARGRRLGSLTLLATARGRRAYDEDDLAFARALAGRAALALDNAGLYAELETTEAQLTAALSTLAEAVTVQRPDGALVYANETAARMFGFASAQELLATPLDRAFAGFDSYHEDGSPVRPEDLPGQRIVAGERRPEPLTVRTVRRDGGELSWRRAKASGVYGRDGSLQLVVNVIEDVTEVKRAEMTARMLARAGEALSSSLDYGRTLQQLAELAVPQLADWCAVSLPDGRGFVRTVAVAHVDPERVEFARRLGDRYPTPADAPTGPAQVIRDAAPQLIDEITDELLQAAAHDEEHLELLRGVGMRAALTLPLTTAGGVVVGALTLVNAESGRRFDEADVELASEIARRAATAIEHTRMYTERSDIARKLQASLMPGRLPEMPGWTSATLYRPAGEQTWVGGDFYDALAVRGGWLAIVGDVAGRGAEAAGLTGLARHTLRAAARLLDDPLEALGVLNDELRARDGMRLCSIAAVYLRDDPEGALAEVVCAGHPLPLLLRAGAVRTVGEFSPMLGAFDVDEWHRTTVVLEAGDVLVLYTDGVLDAVGEQDRFGEERLERALAGAADAADAVARIDAALSAFTVREGADDTAVLAIQRVAVTAPLTPP